MENKKELANQLANLLADTYSLYLTTQNFHWNVEGPHFHSLHLLFETQYTELATAVDTIAEAIRSIGFYAPGTFASYAKRATLKQPDTLPHDMGMVEKLKEGHETLLNELRNALPLSEGKGLEMVNDLLMDRIDIHEKTAWMLRSTLKEGSQTL